MDIEWDEKQVEVKLYSDIDRKVRVQIKNLNAKEINLKTGIDYSFATKN